MSYSCAPVAATTPRAVTALRRALSDAANTEMKQCYTAANRAETKAAGAKMKAKPTMLPSQSPRARRRMIESPVRTAIEVAREAGDTLREYLSRPREIAEKGRRADIVTDADRASERLIVERLRAATPSATIVGEEGGTRAGSSNERWIVDPLDGTTNYAHGYPMFCVSVGYEYAGELVGGVIYAPLLDELYAAERGAGAYCNEQRIHVSEIEGVGDAMLGTGFHPADFKRNAKQFEVMSGKAQAIRRAGSAALDLANVARGRFDGFWEFDLHEWDVAAGIVLIREAGGMATDLMGTTSKPDDRVIVATNGLIHGQVLEALNSAP